MTVGECRFAVFAKYWTPGKVKTRLADTIGDENAAAVYRRFVETILRRCADVGDSREVAFAPDTAEDGFESFLVAEHLTGGWQTHSQGEGDLGTRMRRFFDRSFSTGAKKVVLIGTDSPTLPKEIFSRAFDELERFEAVLGPTEDGGYYLVGARDTTPPIFADIAWSTSKVWQQTVRHLQEHHVSYSTLPMWYDVDEIKDLRRLKSELMRDTQNNRNAAQLFDELCRLLDEPA